MAQGAVYQGGVGLTAGHFHHFPDEESEYLLFAGTELVNLVGIGRDDLVDQGLDGFGVGDLNKSLSFDYGVRGSVATPNGFENLLAHFAG